MRYQPRSCEVNVRLRITVLPEMKRDPILEVKTRGIRKQKADTLCIIHPTMPTCWKHKTEPRWRSLQNMVPSETPSLVSPRYSGSYLAIRKHRKSGGCW